MSTTDPASYPNTRSPIQIVWSCLAIIFACTWTAIHPNVPSQEISSSKLKMIWRRLRMMLWTLVVPELMVGWAFAQWVEANEISEHYDESMSFPRKKSFLTRWRKAFLARWKKIRQDIGDIINHHHGETSDEEKQMPAEGLETPREKDVDDRPIDPALSNQPERVHESLVGEMQNTGKGVSDVTTDAVVMLDSQGTGNNKSSDEDNDPHPAKHGKYHPWTYVHSYFLCMGGFAVTEGEGDNRCCHICSEDAIDNDKCGRISLVDVKASVCNREPYWPNVKLALLADRSKGDVLAKGVVIIQIIWFISQLVARATQGLAITELEVMTLAYALICGLLYCFWFSKPYDVQQPVVVHWPKDRKVIPKNPCKHLLHWLDFLTGRWIVKFHVRVVDEHSAARSIIASMLGAVLFGGIHLIAWKFEFPSELERNLWISSSLWVTAAPLVFCTVAIPLVLCRSIYRKIYTSTVFPFMSAIILNTYFIARVFLIVQPFVLLRGLSALATQAISWSSFFPHI